MERASPYRNKQSPVIMRTQRFNPPKDWLATKHRNYNQYFMDFVAMLSFISLHFKVTNKSRPVRMIEIGSYMGESTMLFAASGIFDSISVSYTHLTLPTKA